MALDLLGIRNGLKFEHIEGPSVLLKGIPIIACDCTYSSFLQFSSPLSN
ncbi:hypothetical protein IHE45_18G003400 [Dioscorea alata]|uniref:Uncharacterized protein n=1 Tax=Dioscorea alata TaxID=55571 RepID=A0ACB7U4X7_DIOAL|nr:hypothetical protein IHE45_18G003400 [Dioscorea alata]